MRKLITGISFAALTAATIAMPTMSNAQQGYGRNDALTWGAPAAGVVAGTVVGLGLTEGWWGAAPTLGGAALPTTAAGAAVVGGVAGIGTLALIDAAAQPCRGFQALFGFNKEACVDGQFVGYGPRGYGPRGYGQPVAYSPRAAHGQRGYGPRRYGHNYGHDYGPRRYGYGYDYGPRR